MELLPITIRQIRLHVAVFLTAVQCILIVVCYFCWRFSWLTSPQSLIIAGILSAMATSIFTSFVFGSYSQKLLKAFGQAILHVSPSTHEPAPKLEELPFAREFMTSMVYQLNQIASLQDNKDLAEHRREATQASNIINHLPLPLFVCNKQQLITFASESAMNYSGHESSTLLGKALYEAVDLDFPTDFTLESWINDCQKHKVTDIAYWRRVRMKLKDDAGTLRQCDMAGYYDRDNPMGTEFIITLFDRTAEYAADDEAMSFTALAVHELRNPLTIMRGNIEALQEELEGKLDPEMTKFMERMGASSKQLATFTNNILNVARIEQNQLPVKLAEEEWKQVVEQAAHDMELRAVTMGKIIKYTFPDNLPTIAVDRVTIYEVLCNLLDNAIKYSGDSKEINLEVDMTKDGLIETVVRDKGVGIPTNVLPSLFEKFHRNHRNRSEISGTGLGLYMSKAIINAHGGDIWVKSKDGQGTSVGFTLQPYSMLAEERKSGDNKDELVRTAHGWIKNHSLYRR